MPYGIKEIVPIDSVNGLMPSGSKPLPEPMLTNTEGDFTENTSKHITWKFMPHEFARKGLRITNLKSQQHFPVYNELNFTT